MVLSLTVPKALPGNFEVAFNGNNVLAVAVLLALNPSTVSAFRLVTFVVEVTASGAVPVATVEVNWPETLREVPVAAPIAGVVRVGEVSVLLVRVAVAARSVTLLVLSTLPNPTSPLTMPVGVFIAGLVRVLLVSVSVPARVANVLVVDGNVITAEPVPVIVTVPVTARLDDASISGIFFLVAIIYSYLEGY